MIKTINIKGTLLELDTPLVMGILNVTPDSFFSDSRKNDLESALVRVEEILTQGGSIIDIGAQSTRPTSTFLTEEEELSRLIPILEAISKEYPDAILSVDTFYSKVAKTCVEKYGVAIVNDISGGELDAKMFETIAELNVPYILMHMKGTPQTMQQETTYKNLFQDISFYFSEKIAKLHKLGVNDIILDPGFGFAKDMDQNFELMKHLNFFQNFDVPLLVGISRKSMICNFLEIKADDALNGTTVLNTFSLLNGANILRVHDVREAVEAVKIIERLK